MTFSGLVLAAGPLQNEKLQPEIATLVLDKSRSKAYVKLIRRESLEGVPDRTSPTDWKITSSELDSKQYESLISAGESITSSSFALDSDGDMQVILKNKNRISNIMTTRSAQLKETESMTDLEAISWRDYVLFTAKDNQK